MNHRYWSKNLSAYLDNEISESKRRKVELHLADCDLCRANLAAWKKIHELHNQEPLLTPAPVVWQLISRKIRSEKLQPLHVWEDERLIKWLPNPVPALVTVMIILLGVFAAQPILNTTILTTTEKTEVTVDRYLTSDTELSSTNGLDILIPTTDESQTSEGTL
jgi:predicted anti-sigma-YlaC factor YlaD